MCQQSYRHHRYSAVSKKGKMKNSVHVYIKKCFHSIVIFLIVVCYCYVFGGLIVQYFLVLCSTFSLTLLTIDADEGGISFLKKNGGKKRPAHFSARSQ